MKNQLVIFFFILFTFNNNAQSVNLNQDYIENSIRNQQLFEGFDNKISFTIRPLLSYYDSLNISNNKFYFKVLPLDYQFDFNSHHPYNRNNGSLIPNKGYQYKLSLGFYSKIGPISIQFKPEHLYAENLDYDGFWDGHYQVIWSKRYHSWNMIDTPERFGDTSYKKNLLGQSSIRINYKKLSLGLSSENLWWGPAKRNGIMMSNNARGFNHITFNTLKPVNSFVGSFEWQLVTGRLESSGYTPPRPDYEYASTLLYVPKPNDWRYFQGLVITYSPSYINGLSVGFIRWIQMYSQFAKDNNDFFPVFDNLFRKNDKYENLDGSLEMSRDQAAGIFLRWLWTDSKAEVYAEFNHNDSKVNFRDLLLDSDHSRAVTVGLSKIFETKYKDTYFKFDWEWTQMEQTNSKKLRNAGSWYHHFKVTHGYTNYGEVIGSSIGPGSNSNYFAISYLKKEKQIKLAIEIIDHDNDWFYKAFEEAFDFRRYWKDYNLHLSFLKKYKNFWLSSNLVYTRSLNYQWEIDDYIEPYYHPGRDVDNFNLNIKLSYFFDSIF